MKKLNLLLMALMVSLTMSAKQVTEQEALQKAQQFMKGKNLSQGKKLSRRASQQKNVSAYYVFNVEDESGFVIVSGDDRTAEILGYSDQGHLDPDSVPDNVKWWLAEYERQIEWLLTSADANAVHRATEANHRAEWTAIEPLVKTKWSQYDPYNDLCPTKDGEKCATGCVATAMAQIMNYYEYPKTGQDSHNYEWNGQTLSMDFSKITFDWVNMQELYSYNDDSPEARSAVATLMSACGISVDMNYGPEASGAFSFDVGSALTNYFDYDANMVYKDETSDWEDLIYTELENEHPVYYSGFSVSSGGHVFVCDGYDGNGMFHINWGWGGSYDGYFLLEVLDPYDKGYGFCWDQLVIIIRPNNPTNPVKSVAIDGVYYKFLEDEMEAMVCPPDKGYYTGDFVIPQTVTYENKTYTVRIRNYIWSYCKDLTSLIVEPSIYQMTDYWSGCLSSPDLRTINLNITHIDDWAFQWCSSLTTLNLGDNLESIGEGAFAGCYALPELTIPDNVKTIGDKAFSGCANLTALKLGLNLETIGEETFYGCNNLKTLELGTGLKAIGDRAFFDCYALAELTIPDNVKTIGEGAFSNCNNLKILKLGANLDSIKNSTFMDCYALAELTIPDNVKVIGNGAFEGCNSLTTLKLGESLEFIGPWAFFDCHALTGVTISDNVKTIGEGAFYGCNNLKTLKLNVNLESIGMSAFSDCNELTELTIPNKVKSIGGGAFSGCKSLTVLKLNTSLDAIGDVAFGNCNALPELTIPDNVKVIGNSAFYSCNNLTALKLSANLESIGDRAFSDCWALPELMIPDNVGAIGDEAFAGCINLMTLKLNAKLESIGTWAFYNCYALTELSIPDKVRSIGDNAFRYCHNLKTLELGAGLESIGDDAFLYSYVLTEIISLNTTPAVITASTFDDITKQYATLYVPIGSRSVYEQAEVWKEFTSIVEFDQTGICQPAMKAKGTNAPVYNISGQEVARPTNGRGIHIVGGKKVFVK